MIETGVPKGSCVSLILAAYFTSPMIGEVHHRTSTCIGKTPELSTLTTEGSITLSPTTLYVDDSAILASGPTLESMAFKEMHSWLAQRGLKMDQVKNELMHFTKSKN